MASDGQLQGESSPLIPVSEDPVCKESPFISLNTWVTPTERYFIRHHFSAVPHVDPSTWHLAIDGEVRRPFNLSFADLLAMPSTEVVMTMECAGNSRSYVTPPAEGLAFRHGAVSTARWKGVPLHAVLEQAGLKESAVEVVFEGADSGREEEDGVAFALHYRRSLPLEKARHPDTLLGYEMNGHALTADHGFPLRLVVPRWYGMASVKWLTRINVLDQAFEGFFQKRRYVMIHQGPELALEREPVTTLKVKSLIASPRHGEVIQPGACTMRGFAWSGEGEVTRVDVSTDGGLSWQEAALRGESDPNAWRQWEFMWQTSFPGHFIVMVRATDSTGNTQPPTITWNFRGYANNAIHTIAIEVPTRMAIPS
jgi:DMSO/TMAO reductase YedYZ molybdopterin-dependent catalytic subunit